MRQVAVALAPACLLLFLPVADLSPGRLTSAEECGPTPRCLPTRSASVST
ncbi:hypothetical protein [Streptosporangium roseum]